MSGNGHSGHDGSMSTPPFHAPTPPPGPPLKPRPRLWWWAGPALLLMAAAVVFVAALAFAIDSFHGPASSVPADGTPHSVTVTGGAEQMLWERAGEPVRDCIVADAATGLEIPLRPNHASYTWNDLHGRYGFTAPGSEVMLSCLAAPSSSGAMNSATVWIGPRPELGKFIGGIFGGIAIPLVLGMGGVVWAIVLGVLAATRPPRKRPQSV